MRNKVSKHAYSDTRSKTLRARTVRTKGATLRRGVNDTLPGVQRRGSPLAGLWGFCVKAELAGANCCNSPAVVGFRAITTAPSLPWAAAPALPRPHSAAHAAGTLRACSSGFLHTSTDTHQLLPAELQDELGPGTGSWGGLSLWGTRIMIICPFENGFGLWDPTTTSYELQLIEDSDCTYSNGDTLNCCK